MRRRDFIAAFGGAAAAWPLAVRAQQAGRLPTIGFLGTTLASVWSVFVAAFVQRLRELGWIEVYVPLRCWNLCCSGTSWIINIQP
jgi:hypothetical protein